VVIDGDYDGAAILRGTGLGAPALLVLYLVSRFIRVSVSRHVSDPDARYRLRKLVTFITYAIALLIIAVSFSERLSGLSVAFGVAGAGIAFALQEVIASVAGWVAVSIGSFYAPGDRVQLGGIKGTSSTSASFAPRSWKSASGSPQISTTAESFEWPTASCSRSRSTTTPRMSVTLAANDNWIQFTARYVVDYRQRRTVRDRLYTRILEEVDRSANRIRLASGDSGSGEPAALRRQADRNRGIDRSALRAVRRGLRHFAGAGAGAAGVGAAGAGAGTAGADAGACGARPPTTELGPRWPRMPSAIAPTTKITAHTVVARDSTVAPLRAPNAA
jgi:hypothetical protein